MTNANPLKKVWEEGGTAFGLWAGIPDSFAAELLAGTGVDYVCVDQQHGLIGYESVVPMFQAAENAGPIRASGVIGSRDPEDLGGEVLCLVMVETREALERVEEISATPGVDGIYIGPSDLALSLGLSPTLSIQEGEHAKAIRRIRDSCHEHGIAAGIHSPDGEWARKHAEDGFGLVTVATDAALLTNAARREVAEARGEAAG